jgi:DNA damage-binding protein 1
MTHGSLLFGQIDANQKLHHTKITLEEEAPIRIQYMALSKSLAVGTVSIDKNVNNGFLSRKGKIQILDAQTFQGNNTTQHHLSLY